MLEPFVALKEAGFSIREGDERASWGWSAELIASLDWLRLAELARAVAANAGCELGGSRVFEDGSVLFAIFEQPKSAKPRRSLVKLAAWNEWGATPQSVEAFAREVATARNARGIFIAPGGFTAAARHAASEHHIEAVDAAQMAGTLRALPVDQADFFHAITTAGDCSTPSCPSCLKKLTRDQRPASEDSAPENAEYIFQSSAIVAEPVHCRRIEVMPQVEVQFLHEVRTQEMVVHGHVTGDFVCDGRLTLGAGATLNGTVAARAVDVRDGGELLGKARIIEGDLRPVTPIKPRLLWRCRNPLGKPACAKVVFEAHD